MSEELIKSFEDITSELIKAGEKRREQIRQALQDGAYDKIIKNTKTKE
jgi:hypothetical protein